MDVIVSICWRDISFFFYRAGVALPVRYPGFWCGVWSPAVLGYAKLTNLHSPNHWAESYGHFVQDVFGAAAAQLLVQRTLCAKAHKNISPKFSRRSAPKQNTWTWGDSDDDIDDDNDDIELRRTHVSRSG